MDKGYEVEWCVGIPKDEFGESDFDNAKYRYREFKTRAAALKFAKDVLKEDVFGAVRVCRFEIIQMEKEFVNDPEYVDNE